MSKTNPNDFTEQLKRWADKERHNRKLAVKLVLQVMKQHNIKCVACTYAGEGDDGQMEDFYVLNNPIEPEEVYSVSDNNDAVGAELLANTKPDTSVCECELFSRWCSPPGSLQELIEYMASYVTPEGYENGNGGQGTIVFDAVNNEAKLEHGTNHVEVDYSTEEIDLEEDEDAEISS